MKRLLDKFSTVFADTPEDPPQVRHRATVLNDLLRQGRKQARRENRVPVREMPADPRVAFIVERDELDAGDDPYNSSDYDRADSWKNGGGR